jgi:hypothetical protein
VSLRHAGDYFEQAAMQAAFDALSSAERKRTQQQLRQQQAAARRKRQP